MNAKDTHWHLDRAEGIGGSDLPAVLGISPWRTALDVYNDKRRWLDDPERELARVDEEGTPEYMYWGTALEPLIAKRLEEESGLRLSKVGSLSHPEYPECRVNIDYRAYDPEGVTHGVVDCKAANRFRIKEWTDGTPAEVRAQVMWGAGIFALRSDEEDRHIDVTFGVGAGLIGGNRFMWSRFDHDPHFFSAAVECATAFWRRVLDGNPPPALGHRDLKAIAALYPDDDGNVIQLSDEAIELDAELVESKALRLRHDKRCKDIEVRLRELMGTATWGRIGDEAAYRLKVEEKKGYTVTASRPRVLRRMKGVIR